MMRYVRDHVCSVCGETDWDNEAEIARHYVDHDSRGEQPGDAYVGGRIGYCGLEGVVTNITNTHVHVTWDETLVKDELPFGTNFEILAA